MIPLNISLENSQGVTVLSNVFIDQYMCEINEAQIKIYLYILRMTGANLPTDISEMADKFNFTEKDVEKSLNYLEKKGLLSLQYNGAKLSGIMIKDLNRTSEAVSDDIRTGDMYDQGAATSSEKDMNVPGQMVVTKDSVNQEIPMIKMDYEREKEKYSLEDIQNIKSEPEVKMLINVAQEYFKTPMNPAAIRTIVFIYDRLAFTFDLIDFLLERCVEDGNKSIHYLETLAKFLYEQGIKDTDEAKKVIDKIVPSFVPRVMGYMGLKDKPIKQQTVMIKRWILEYGFSLEIIEQACTKAVLGGKEDKFSYVETVLSDWKDHQIHSLSDLEAYNQKFADEKQAKKEARTEARSEVKNDQKKTYGPNVSAGQSSGKSDFCSMKKRDYDFDALLKAARVN